MSAYYDRIKNNVLGTPISDEAQRAVMSVLWKNFDEREGRKATQKDIATSQRWLGCHPRHEGLNSTETTLRNVRQIIRDLRIEKGVPILSSRDGYWICTSEHEAAQYMDLLEREARSQAAAWFETYTAMKKSLQKQSSYLEQLSLIHS